MSNSPFSVVPSPFREMMEEIDPRAFYIFSDNLATKSPMSCVKVDSDASAAELLRVQHSQGGTRGRTLRGDDVRALILTLAQAHGLHRGIFVDLRATVQPPAAEDLPAPRNDHSV